LKHFPEKRDQVGLGNLADLTNLSGNVDSLTERFLINMSVLLIAAHV
jgi:hypothetical protein